MEFDDEIPQPPTDARSWSTWHEGVKTAIHNAGLRSYLDGTVSEPNG
jgi:hypothetical protein